MDPFDSRAKEIVFSSINILDKSKGKIRVGRLGMTKNGEHEKDQPTTGRTTREYLQKPTPSTQFIPTGQRIPTTRRVSSNVEGFGHDTDKDIQPKRNAEQEMALKRLYPTTVDYKYKPPASTKFFLWDSTRISTTIKTSTTKSLPKTISMTESVLKALKMHFLKKELLKSANLGLEETGNMLARVDFTDHLKLVVDRFETGRIVVKLNDDVLIRVYDKSSDGFLQSLREVQDWFHQQNVSNIEFVYPLACLVSHTNAEELEIDLQLIVPDYKLEVCPIYPLRLVHTDTSHKLLSSLPCPMFGLLSIDQGRQVYLLNCNDSKVSGIPLIGIWCRNMKNMTDPKLLGFMARFIVSKAYAKMDTGKSQFLVCHFPLESSGKPEFFEVNYEKSGVGCKVFGGDGNRIVERDVSGDFEFCKAWEDVFGAQLFPDKLNSSSDDTLSYAQSLLEDSVQSDELVDCSSVEAEKVNAEIVELEQNDEKTPVTVEHMQSNEVEVEKKEAQPTLPVLTPESKPEFVPKLNQSVEEKLMPPISVDISTQQMMYISLLQQQINALQSQLLNKNLFEMQLSAKPDEKPVLRKQTVSIGTQTEDIQNGTIGTNTTFVEEKTPVRDAETNTSVIIPESVRVTNQSDLESHDISQAQEIIQNLVSDAEQSFCYAEREEPTINDQTCIFNTKESFSFATRDYLKKYGLK